MPPYAAERHAEPTDIAPRCKGYATITPLFIYIVFAIVIDTVLLAMLHYCFLIASPILFILRH